MITIPRSRPLPDIPRSKSGKTALQLAIEITQRAGDTLLQRFDGPMIVSYKSRGNIVTDVDTEVEETALCTIRDEYPEMDTLGEETAGVAAGQGYVWIIDPLDGTRNYASGIPFYSTVIGLALCGEVLVGVNYDPVRGEMFYAEKGGGAFLNGDPIRASNRLRMADCIIGTDMSYNDEGAANSLEAIGKIWPRMQTVRIMGSAALGISYVAAGRTDLYFHDQLQPWDMVAGLLMVEESGGVVFDRGGKRAGLYSDGLVASNANLHGEFKRHTENLGWWRSRGTPD